MALTESVVNAASCRVRGKIATAKPEKATDFKSLRLEDANRRRRDLGGLRLFSIVTRNFLINAMRAKARGVRRSAIMKNYRIPRRTARLIAEGSVSKEEMDAVTTFAATGSALVSGGQEADYIDENGKTWRVHYFDSSSVIKVLRSGQVEMLAVGGGGGGSGAIGAMKAESRGGGGGGAGGEVNQIMSLDEGMYDLFVGAGGAGGAPSLVDHAGCRGHRGGNSYIRRRDEPNDIICEALGGGAAVSFDQAANAENNGGCGGGYSYGVGTLTTVGLKWDQQQGQGTQGNHGADLNIADPTAIDHLSGAYLQLGGGGGGGGVSGAGKRFQGADKGEGGAGKTAAWLYNINSADYHYGGGGAGGSWWSDPNAHISESAALSAADFGGGAGGACVSTDTDLVISATDLADVDSIKTALGARISASFGKNGKASTGGGGGGAAALFPATVLLNQEVLESMTAEEVVDHLTTHHYVRRANLPTRRYVYRRSIGSNNVYGPDRMDALDGGAAYTVAGTECMAWSPSRSYGWNQYGYYPIQPSNTPGWQGTYWGFSSSFNASTQAFLIKHNVQSHVSQGNYDTMGFGSGWTKIEDDVLTFDRNHDDRVTAYPIAYWRHWDSSKRYPALWVRGDNFHGAERLAVVPDIPTTITESEYVGNYRSAVLSSGGNGGSGFVALRYQIA